VGYQSLDAETAGDYNTAIGYGALSAQNDGDLNTAVGYEAGLSHTTGSPGYGGNTFLGGQAGKYNGAGRGNTFVGSECALGDSGAVLTGNYNVAVGQQSGKLLQGAGHENTFVGAYAGDILTTGSDNTCIGKSADTDDATAINQTVIGHSTTGVADNSVTLGNADVTAVYMASDSGATVHAAGIKFDASGEVLGDYEEGSADVTIACGSGTATLSAGINEISYTKIGRQVSITGQLYVSAISSPSGSVNISGLPFTVSNHGDGDQTGHTACYLRIEGLTGTINVPMAYFAANSTSIVVKEFTGTTAADMGDHLAVGTYIMVSGTYFV
jgi:hypothetical protein